MIYNLINNLQIEACNTKMVNMVSFGDIQDYNHKSDIRYPYINLDVVNCQTINYAKIYTIRVYVCDRNKSYVAYNKCETILDEFCKKTNIDITNYLTNYFSLDFQDEINGVWSDIQITEVLESPCEYIDIQAIGNFVLNENDDLIKIEDVEGNVLQEK